MSVIAKNTNFQHYGLIAQVDPLWLLKFWTNPSTSSSAVASLAQDEDAADGLLAYEVSFKTTGKEKPALGRAGS